MTYIEAIKFINERIDFIKANLNDDIAEYREALVLSAMAIDKQIPKKPDRWESGHACCSCKRGIVREDNYCCYCGQKIDWNE